MKPVGYGILTGAAALGTLINVQAATTADNKHDKNIDTIAQLSERSRQLLE